MRLKADTEGLTLWSQVSPGVGFEPTTNRLTVYCSTAELTRNGIGNLNQEAILLQFFLFGAILSLHILLEESP
jgi:hypothetical protein